jgi:hypothetical protein
VSVAAIVKATVSAARPRRDKLDMDTSPSWSLDS